MEYKFYSIVYAINNQYGHHQYLIIRSSYVNIYLSFYFSVPPANPDTCSVMAITKVLPHYKTKLPYYMKSKHIAECFKDKPCQKDPYQRYQMISKDCVNVVRNL